MAMVLLREMDDRFQADLWSQALDARAIPYLLRTYQDTAYDGLFVSQRGYASLYVDEADLAQALQVDQDLARSLPASPGELPPLDLDDPDPAALARRLDHTLLDPAAGQAELERHLDQCLEMGVAAACISPWMVPLAAPRLAGGPVALCTVVGFPLGTHTPAAKLAEARELFGLGATELDVVINRGLIASGRLEEAVAEVEALAAALPGALLKVIVESAALGSETTRALAQRLAQGGAAYLKTGSGYFGSATTADVALLKEAGAPLEVKAAGGIRTLEQALALCRAGASRLGTSSGLAIWQEARQRRGQDQAPA